MRTLCIITVSVDRKFKKEPVDGVELLNFTDKLLGLCAEAQITFTLRCGQEDVT